MTKLLCKGQPGMPYSRFEQDKSTIYLTDWLTKVSLLGWVKQNVRVGAAASMARVSEKRKPQHLQRFRWVTLTLYPTYKSMSVLRFLSVNQFRNSAKNETQF